MTRTMGLIACLAVTPLLAVPALGSGPSEPRPVYVFADPQSGAERAQMAGGRLPIVKGATSEALLYVDWRRLNGLAVDQVAMDALSKPCCDAPGRGGDVWQATRKQVPGVPAQFWISTERRGPNYTAIPTCFDDAFTTAAATLTDRIRRFGAASPMVRAWTDGQDAVFKACSEPVAALPTLPVGAPDWLRADRAYQDAALALYNGQTSDAGRRFAAIAADAASPWRPLGLYLSARTLLHAAVDAPDKAHFAVAHAAIDRLATAPAGTYGQGELTNMRQVLEYREHPDQLRDRLARQLAQPAPIPGIAVAFRDYMTLSDHAAVRPEGADWIRTIQAKDRGAGLAHAVARWRASGTSAWLVAALTLADPGDAPSRTLAAAAARVAPADPAWLTARYHRLRLLIPSADAAIMRAEADAVLARPDLTRSDRNIFLAVRAQAAASLADFAGHALREPYCDVGSTTCTIGYNTDDDLVGRLATGGFAGLALDTRTIVDSLPLAERMALVDQSRFPRETRMDIALTSYVRAVQLQDDTTIDRLTMRLANLLPQVRADWLRIARTRPGPDKRFAEVFVLAKIPGARADLADYERPTGTARQFAGYWIDLGRREGRRQHAAGASAPTGWREAATRNDPDGERDAACLDKCGGGTFALHTPPFLTPLVQRAAAERRAFLVADVAPATNARRVQAVSLWTEALAYVAAHPDDLRAPETLYRLVRVGRWGGSHDHLGHRAFRLLHSRYPTSTWTKQSPYYYD